MATNNVINNAFADNYTAPNKVSKNLMVGGNFTTNPWQRGTSFVSPANAAFTADQFQFRNTTTAAVTITKTADSPTVAQAGILSTHCLEVQITTDLASVAAGDILYMQNTLEGFSWANIFNRPFTLSFWVKATKTGIYSISFENSPITLAYVAEYTINASNTWEFKTITVTANPGGTWATTHGAGLRIAFTLVSGATFQTSPNSWVAGDFKGSTNQVNGADSIFNSFRLALVQIEAGTVATPFEQLTAQEVLTLCQRYFNMTFNQGVIPAQASGSLLGALQYRLTRGGIVTTSGTYYRLITRMRTTPTYVAYNPINATSGFYNVTKSANSGVSSLANGGGTGASYRCSQIVGDAVGDLVAIHATASAEM